MVRDLVVEYPVTSQHGLGRRRLFRAVDGVNFEIGARETVGLVGESGSGKTTTGLAILRLLSRVRGTVVFEGRDILAARREELRRLRRSMQVVFQDPYSSLDPSMTVFGVLSEPLTVHEKVSRRERHRRAVGALALVGLGPEHLDSYPHEFSGGQQQRIALARAIILRPRLIVCDEAVSSLDVSTQGQILALLNRFQEEFGTSYLFIAHDLAVVHNVSHRIAVMYLGRIVETGPSVRVCREPAHPYTASLLSSVPKAKRRHLAVPGDVAAIGEIPDPAHPPAGCRFHTRCPFRMEICVITEPPVVDVRGGGTVACHLHVEGPQLEGASIWELVRGRVAGRAAAIGWGATSANPRWPPGGLGDEPEIGGEGAGAPLRPAMRWEAEGRQRV